MPLVEVTLTSQGSMDALTSALTTLTRAREVIARGVAVKLRDAIESRTPVGDPKTDKHSGQLKRSWSEVQASADDSFSFGTNVGYAPTVEQGLYKSAGPRTVSVGGGGIFSRGIFSRQAPGGMIQPIIDDSDLIDRLVNEIVDRVIAGIRND